MSGNLPERRKATHPATEAETQRLVHELQVHQIELEMQNEEVTQSRAKVEASKNKGVSNCLVFMLRDDAKAHWSWRSC
jgi:hypothetical protein